MNHLTRRAFLSTCSRLGLGAAAAATFPAWARAAAAKTASGSDTDVIVRNDMPEHWETSLEALGRSWITPNDRFFARSHFPAPKIDLRSYRLEIVGMVQQPQRYTLAELRARPHTDAAYTLECAGNGRGLFHLPSTSGTQWEYGAVGNARWTGVKASLLLEGAGVAPGAKHVWLEAADAAPLAVPRFVRSIPIEKAMDDVLLAWDMNGASLPRTHGAPLRAIVPGWFGMASTKWLLRLRVEAAPSDNHFMVRGYRYTYPGEDPAQAPPVEEVRVKSVITRPLEGARVAPGGLVMTGFAWAGRAGVDRVEVSPDGGANWFPARLTGEETPFAWRSWEVEAVPVSPGPATLMARATDRAGESQPLEARANAGGYGNNAIHRVKVDVRA